MHPLIPLSLQYSRFFAYLTESIKVDLRSSSQIQFISVQSPQPLTSHRCVIDVRCLLKALSASGAGERGAVKDHLQTNRSRNCAEGESIHTQERH